ncbi:MAG: alanine dehydrogenase [Phycisphaerae bacterium]|jgi:alanine dehydrogenase|nr:alanine dehydrogenase [Phycisphaerae bacterium]
MIVGVPTEVKTDEFRVGLRPVGAEMLARDGHTVLIQAGAGVGSGFTDEHFVAAGARIVATAEEVWATSDLIVKVKEPQPQECVQIRQGQFVFTYFHFAADRDLTVACLERRCTAIAYETLTDDRGGLPLLTPMSEVAGKLSVQEGAKFLERPFGGKGVLLGGVPGVAPGHVLILGGGVVGTCAAMVAAGMGADVVIMDISIDRLRRLAEIMPANVRVVYSDLQSIRERLHWADLIVGAVLVPGAKAPWLIRRDDLKYIQTGSVIVDVAIDQGGCVETSRVTTHRNPVYEVDGVVHYCVGNMPGAVARTSTLALTNVTLPWALRLAKHGPETLARRDPHFANAINTHRGQLTNSAVAAAHGLEFTSLSI